MGRSACAYALWIELHEGSAAADNRAAPPKIIRPVIDCRSGREGLDRTIRSIVRAAPGAQPVIIGHGSDTALPCIERPRGLAAFSSDGAGWLLPMRPGDELSDASISTYGAAAAKAAGAWLMYADDDLIDENGKRRAPHFKPRWNPELFEHHDFITGATIVRADRQILARLPDDGWAEFLVRAALERGAEPVHLQAVLHHRRSRPEPVVPPKPAAHAFDSGPAVTAIIPTRNRHELLRKCIEGLRRTRYNAIETIVIDNGSDETETLDYLTLLEADGTIVLRMPGPFNYSALNNAAVKHARGNLLCFLNNDVEMTDPDWLSLLAQHAMRTDIGAVGARLLYPDGTLQHAGVFTGIGGGAGHAHRFQRADEPGYFERARLPQRVSAVTGACLVVARDKFLAVGGFDEERFPVAFNDVDLCLKLNARGWQSFYEPRSTLIHHESKSRGSDASRGNRARFAAELAALKEVWNTDEFHDPYHHPNLSPFCEQFLVAI